MSLEEAREFINKMKTKSNKTQLDIANLKIALNIVAGGWARRP